jgi:hypothetical protein
MVKAKALTPRFWNEAFSTRRSRGRSQRQRQPQASIYILKTPLGRLKKRPRDQEQWGSRGSRPIVQ